MATVERSRSPLAERLMIDAGTKRRLEH